jgi:hypothetical protein
MCTLPCQVSPLPVAASHHAAYPTMCVQSAQLLQDLLCILSPHNIAIVLLVASDDSAVHKHCKQRRHCVLVARRAWVRLRVEIVIPSLPHLKHDRACEV